MQSACDNCGKEEIVYDSSSGSSHCVACGLEQSCGDLTSAPETDADGRQCGHFVGRTGKVSGKPATAAQTFPAVLLLFMFASEISSLVVVVFREHCRAKSYLHRPAELVFRRRVLSGELPEQYTSIHNHVDFIYPLSLSCIQLSVKALYMLSFLIAERCLQRDGLAGQ